MDHVGSCLDIGLEVFGSLCPTQPRFGLRPRRCVKALVNEDTLLRTHCCRHIVADTNVSPFARARKIRCGHKFCVWDTKNVSDFLQKHFVSATNVFQFAQPKKHHGQQCVLVCQYTFTNLKRGLRRRGAFSGNRIAKIHFF